MTGWIILGVYLLGYVLTWRRVAFFIARDLSSLRSGIKGEDVAFGCFLGSILTVFWPVIWTAVAVRAIYAARGMNPSALITPRSVRKQEELLARERRIASMERELGIK